MGGSAVHCDNEFFATTIRFVVRALRQAKHRLGFAEAGVR